MQVKKNNAPFVTLPKFMNKSCSLVSAAMNTQYKYIFNYCLLNKHAASTVRLQLKFHSYRDVTTNHIQYKIIINIKDRSSANIYILSGAPV